jgi:predicted Ser/Thr protein kinase
MPSSKAPDRKRVGPYTIIERLGDGGMGVVYRGKSKEHEAAVKVIRESMLEREDIRTRFTREIQTLQAIESPHVARILGSDITKKTAWMATEFVEGRSLKDLVDADGPLDEEAWASLAEGLLGGLVAIHDAGVIHQDVKPANIMMSPAGPKIIDFGISREIGSTRVTMTGMFAGSAGWMAPERAELDIETTASDVFSAGLVLAFAALGKHPWDGDTTQSDVAITLSMLSKAPDLGALTERQSDLVQGMLNMDSDKRPSATRALGILRGTIAPERIPAKPNLKAIQANRWNLALRKTSEITLARSAIKGVLFALVSVGLAFIGGYAVTSGSGSARAMRSLEISSWLLGDAFGYRLSALDFDWVLATNSQVTTTLGFRPLLVTIVLLLIVFRFSRKVETALGETKWTNRVFHIALFSVPLLLAITGLRLFSSESLLVRGSGIALAQWTVFDVAFSLLLVFATAVVGVFAGRQTPAASAIGWVYTAFKRGAPFFLTVLGGLLVSLAIYTAIAPTFANSIRTFNESRPFLNYGPQDYVALYLFMLAFLPALLIAFLSFVVAGRAGIYVQRDNSVVFEVLQASSGSGSSPWLVLVPSDYLFTGLFVLFLVVSGLISGAAVLNRTGIGPTNVRGMAKVGLVTTFFVILAAVAGASRAFSIQGSWAPTLLVHSSESQFYVSLLVALIFGLLFSASVIAGSRPALWQFLVRSLPRTIAGFRAHREAKDRKRFVLPRVAGVGVLSLISAVFIAPVAVASTELVLAIEETPEKTASQWADDLERRDVDELTQLISNGSESRLPWLPSSVIDDARPSPAANRVVNVANLNGSKWGVGELDALAKVQWVGEGGGASWDLPIQGSVKRIWRYLRVVEYEAEVKPIVFTLSQETVGDESSSMPGVTVNGEQVAIGSYLAVPGTYRFSREGIGFLAPFSDVASSSSDEFVVTIPAEFQAPEGSGSMMIEAVDKVQDACGSLRASRCIEYADISRYMLVQSGQAPASYYTSSETGYVRGDVRCAAGKNEFLGLFDIAHVADCFQIITSEKTFYNSRQIAEPVYSLRCARYRYSWYWGFYCARYEQYQSGTNYRTVVGSPIATVRSKAEVPFRVHVTGGLEEDGTFVVKNAEVR